VNVSIHAISAFKDNYVWLLANGKRCIAVDPGDAKPVLSYLKQHDLVLEALLITHHHWDHCNGIMSLRQQYALDVYGPSQEELPHCDHPLKHGDTVELPGFPSFEVLDIPGHTAGHIAFYTPGWLFCGDTLFTAGCGRVFTGTAQQMLSSLDQLNSLPAETLVYCGHEYTLKNLQFAQCVEPNNPAIAQRLRETQTLREQSLPSVPASLAIERLTNPFLRVREASVQQAVSQHSALALTDACEVFAQLRAWKDSC
jgi:hydroxyacylglutathione hydrolase